ncbi:hypothetical protein Ahy_B02g061471 [Arachis hypogaea]|uniref:Phosphoribulokinase/uridine kinase domain-containing protein n=1 Tax=Arachis hypogaea TaxID=3818 RepID=A0A445AL16_ARAHY|nr:hypothetical protein Ahy_B02g061471 [Arachis hypogaea]
MCFDPLCSSMCFDPLLLSSLSFVLYLLRFDHLLVELRSSTSLFVELRSSLLTFITASHCSIITAHVFGEILIFGILLQVLMILPFFFLLYFSTCLHILPIDKFSIEFPICRLLFCQLWLDQRLHILLHKLQWQLSRRLTKQLKIIDHSQETHHYKVRMANIFGLRLRASESIKIMVIMEVILKWMDQSSSCSGNSWLQHGFNSTNTFGINEYRQGPLYSVFPTKPAQVSSVQDLFEFICSGPLLEKIGVTAEMVAEYIDKWLLYGRLLSQLFQLNELYLTIGFSAPQGCGKTTLVFALDYLFQKTGRKSATISIDDFYLTAEGQGKLREANPGNSLLEVVIHMICRRVADPSTWPEVEGPLTVVLFEGWMLGFKPLPTEVVKAVDLQVRTRNSYLVFHGEGSSQVNL